jgi:secreted trypsin-like serine protease
LAAGNYWILIQNWQGSGAPLDTFIYAVTVIQAGGGSDLAVDLPASSTLGVPFAIDVSWEVPGWTTGEQRSAVLLLTDGDSGEELARADIHVLRGPDDVEVAATGPTVLIPGSVLTHTVTIVPEADDGDGEVVYQLVETLPAGMSYVAGSSSIGEPTVDGAVLTFHVSTATGRRYHISTSDDDFYCGLNAGYPDLKTLAGVMPDETLVGSAFNVPVGTGNGGAFPVDFDGQFVPNGLYVTADGLIHTNASNPANWPVSPFTALPDPALPNGLLAPFWRDLAVVYDGVLGRGLSLYRSPAEHFWVAEWDGAEPAPIGSTNQRYNFAVAGHDTVSDNTGDFEYIFYYGDMINLAGPLVIGYENGDGSQGETVFAGDIATVVLPAALCLNYVVASTSFTYALRIAGEVAAPATLEVNTQVDPGLNGYEARPGARQYEVVGVHLQTSVEAPASVVPGTNIPMTIIVANLGPNVAMGVTAAMELMPNMSLVSGGTLSGTTVLVALGDIPGFASRTAVVEVAPAVSLLPAAPVSAAEAGVIGGKVAAPGAWPWQAALLFEDVEDNYAAQTCGGTLLSSDWVLTAAHCLAWDASTAAGLDVLLGTNVLSNTAPYQRIPVAYGVIHPQADEAAFRYDTALLRLSEPAIITGVIGVAGSVLPVALLTAQDALLLDPSILLMATGWGSVSAVAPSYPRDLFQVQVPYVDQATCSADYTALGFAEDTIGPDQVCAGFEEGGKDTCYGDSGGPLLLNVAGTWRQAGITSWGEGCAEPGAPGVYSNVPHQYDWITLDGINTFVNGAITVADATGDYTDFLPNSVVSVVFRAAPTALDPVDEPDAVHYKLFLPGVNK